MSCDRHLYVVASSDASLSTLRSTAGKITLSSNQTDTCVRPLAVAVALGLRSRPHMRTLRMSASPTEMADLEFTWATEVVPTPGEGCAFCVHQHMIARHGIVDQENMNLDELAADGVYTFM